MEPTAQSRLTGTTGIRLGSSWVPVESSPSEATPLTRDGCQAR